jgi:hypothetical protein
LTNALGLGFGLKGASIVAASIFTAVSSVESSDLPSETSSKPVTSFLAAFMQWNGYGLSFPKLPTANISSTSSDPPSSDPPPKPNVKVVSAKKFVKASKNEPDSICYLRFHDSHSPVFINSFSNPADIPVDPDGVVDDDHPLDNHSDADEDFKQFIPDKYRAWADTVFNPSEFDKLPEHRPYDIDIELEEGKTPPFGPIYRLTPDEREAVAEYVSSNL